MAQYECACYDVMRLGSHAWACGRLHTLAKSRRNIRAAPDPGRQRHSQRAGKAHAMCELISKAQHRRVQALQSVESSAVLARHNLQPNMRMG